MDDLRLLYKDKEAFVEAWNKSGGPLLMAVEYFRQPSMNSPGFYFLPAQYSVTNIVRYLVR
ncbi:MAG: hypothetical protein DCF15_16415 [Phormidesmis priestleyi]|uniref:Uncharacterized protein n=1 Tax=Phormidesmis priestleyi TaxID=268141 RepID=A0A2W4WXR9_9CYAN|nr:MAG: hypothetical protein DCF15_16415 [Phormidesmis priestleyi]